MPGEEKPLRGRSMPEKRRKTENATNPGQNLSEEIPSWIRDAYSESRLGLECLF
jgi:hypothetical protein